MSFQVAHHLFNDVNIFLVTNRDQTGILNDKSHRNCFVIFLIFFQVQDIVDKGDRPVFSIVVHMRSFIFIQSVLNRFFVNIVFLIEIGILCDPI